jgi:suppressor of fused protein SUFU
LDAEIAVIDPNAIRAHFESHWDARPETHRLTKGPIGDLPDGFSVLEFEPGVNSRLWRYATCGLFAAGRPEPIELYLIAPQRADDLVELLTVVAHYHCTGRPLGVGHLVRFGRAWLAGSRCDRGLVCLPYADGPQLEHLYAAEESVRVLWLLPVTDSEAAFAAQHGLEALEREFDAAKLEYWNPRRDSAV